MPDYLIPDHRSFTVFYLLTLRKLDFEHISELSIVKSNDSLTLDNIKRKYSLAEDTGGTFLHPSAKHAWSNLERPVGVRSQDFLIRNVLLRHGMLHFFLFCTCIA
jgi:hypothetical protein